MLVIVDILHSQIFIIFMSGAQCLDNVCDFGNLLHENIELSVVSYTYPEPSFYCTAWSSIKCAEK